VSDLRENELLIEREFDAPLPLVFRLWESRDHMLRWWGPELFTAIELDWELTPKQYGLSRFGGVIREVQKNKRIVFTFQWDENSGRDRDTLVTVTFAEKDGNTLQTFHQAPFSSVASRDSHVGGWNSLFNKQQIYVENIAVAEQHGFRA
jgi:uncharacterized protein YndB with AHSA1/START domain